MTTTTTTPTTSQDSQYVYFEADGNPNQRRLILTGSAAKSTFTELPIIDVGALASPNVIDRQQVAAEVCRACREVGFMYIKNHGVSQDVIDDTYALMKEWFKKPTEEKMETYIHKGKNLRGYEPVKAVGLKGEEVEGNRRESFLFNYEPEYDPEPPNLTPEQRKNIMENQWPANDPQLKETLFKYHIELMKLARRLMRCFALALGQKEDAFDKMMTHPNAVLRVLHYPPQKPTAEAKMGIGAHTDYSAFTILNQDQVGGLEVLNANGQWVSATPIPGTFVVNVGDFLQRMTNDQFVSTVHRVGNYSGKERYSIPFFFSLDFDAYVQVLDSCIDEERPAKYEPIRVVDYYAMRHGMQRKQEQLKKSIV